jgi:hypothetical protein
MSPGRESKRVGTMIAGNHASKEKDDVWCREGGHRRKSWAGSGQMSLKARAKGLPSFARA